MRLNQYIAASTHLSRRSADEAIEKGRVSVNHRRATIGQIVSDLDSVTLDGLVIKLLTRKIIALNKPRGYITSRRRQGSSPTIYELLPPTLSHLKPIGRLDKDSSGLLIMTNDGRLAQVLGHPSAGKWKEYQVTLNKPLESNDFRALAKGVELEDGVSHLHIDRIHHPLAVKLQEGRNRQIRRTLAALGYEVTTLHRVKFAKLNLGKLKSGAYKEVRQEDLL